MVSRVGQTYVCGRGPTHLQRWQAIDSPALLSLIDVWNLTSQSGYTYRWLIVKYEPILGGFHSLDKDLHQTMTKTGGRL